HIGFEEDKALAEQLDPAWGVDIIIGGHSHTFIEEPAIVNDILIVQVGTGTDQIGRFDLVVDTDTNRLHDYRWQNIPIDADHCPKDAALEGIISYYKSQTDAKYQRMITRFKRQLTHPSRYQETEIGGLFADIIKESLRLDIMLLGSGSIRTTELGPIVLLSDLAECFPYNDPIYMCQITGAQLKRMMLHVLRDEALDGGHTEFYQLSGRLRVVYDRTTHSFTKFEFRDVPIEDEHLYRVGLQSYHFKNFEANFAVPMEEIAANGKPRIVTTDCQELLEEYLSEHQNLERGISGRLIVQ
ncbi:MAG: bifunctional metallophosphatase/5'-nucleotidase, partial [Ruminococcaceae bacterium]|nr:bifunctional metallophosphatase/5'-nucleotidase [Oscillospiraceae bacterium]